MVCPCAVFVEAEQVRVFPSSKQEPIAVGGGGKLSAITVVNGRRAKGVVFVTLNHIAAGVKKVGHATFVVLLIIVSHCRAKRGIIAHQDLMGNIWGLGTYGVRAYYRQC